MRRLVTGILLSAAFLSACSPGKKETITAADMQKTFVKPFSDSLSADTFRLQIEGERPEDMRLHFTITSYRRHQIYDTLIPASSLFKNYDATINLNKKNNQIKFLKEEMSRFFDEENFMEPAVTESETPDKNVPDKAFFEELKQKQLNGFAYRLGKDQKIYIAWSTLQGKVKTYYSCCKP